MTRNGAVSFWAQSAGLSVSHPPLDGDVETDVAIVGGGYTGLWTAYYLAELDPALSVVVLEREFAGFGASGRNGGWLTNSITGGRALYAREYGRSVAETFQHEMTAAVHEVIRILDVHGIDADVALGGDFLVARNGAQERRLDRAADAAAGWPQLRARRLDADEARERIAVAGARGALTQPNAARIHPAKLAAGLARIVTERGARIFEATEALEIAPGRVGTRRGTVRARHIIRATEGFTAGLPGHRRTWLPMNSSMIVTEPLPADAWAEIGWSGRELLEDFAHVYVYSQRTADDRIAIGGRGVPYRFGSRTDRNGETHTRTIRSLARTLAGMFPVLGDVRVEHAWSGVLGVPRDWRPSVHLDPATGMGWAGGYVGTGVTATNLAGRTLAELITGNDSVRTTLPWVDHTVRRWEPEPLRWAAVKAIYAAYGIADAAERAGYPVSFPTARIADWVSGRA